MNVALCISCNKEVTGRQHSLQCDGCERWQHRKCKTGIDLQTYRKMTKSQRDGTQIEWRCDVCKRHTVDQDFTIPTPLIVDEDVSSIMGLERREEDMDASESMGSNLQMALPLESTRIDRLSGAADSRGIFNISTSVDRSVVEEQTTRSLHESFTADSSRTSVQNETVITDASTASAYERSTVNETAGPALDASFDLTVHVEVADEEVVEQSIRDRTLLEEILPNQSVTFTVVENGTERSKTKLVSSDGYEYTKKVLQALREKLGQPQVECFVMDFEKGAWKAVRTVFPNTLIKGCAFHFSQAVWRKTQELGLATTYTQRGAEYRYIRSLLALPFLPPADISRAFDQLDQRANAPELQQLNRYIRSTWLENATWCPRTWSVYQQRVRTNNDVEGWHTRLIANAGRASLTFYLLVPLLRREADHVELTQRLVSEEQILRDQRTLYTRLQNRLQQIWEQYAADEISASQLLRECGRIYGPADD